MWRWVPSIFKLQAYRADRMGTPYSCSTPSCPTLGSQWSLAEHETYCDDLHRAYYDLSDELHNTSVRIVEQGVQHAEEMNAEHKKVESLTQKLKAERETSKKLREEVQELRKGLVDAKRSAATQEARRFEQSNSEILASHVEYGQPASPPCYLRVHGHNNTVVSFFHSFYSLCYELILLRRQTVNVYQSEPYEDGSGEQDEFQPPAKRRLVSHSTQYQL